MRGLIVGLFVIESLCLVFFGGCVLMLAGSSPGMGGRRAMSAEASAWLFLGAASLLVPPLLVAIQSWLPVKSSALFFVPAAIFATIAGLLCLMPMHLLAAWLAYKAFFLFVGGLYEQEQREAAATQFPRMVGPLTPGAERTGADRHPVGEPPGHRTSLTGPVASPPGRGRPQAG